MGTKTSIEWTDSTWGPLRGCSRVSEGCRNCYAERIAARFCGPGRPFEGLAVMHNGNCWTR
jgi:protein gp37